MYYEALQNLTHERREQLLLEACAQRLAREARGRRQARRQRLALGAALELLRGARRQTARLRGT